MFKQVEKLYEMLCDGHLRLEARELFDTHDNESIYYQVLPTLQQFDYLLAQTQSEQIVAKPAQPAQKSDDPSAGDGPEQQEEQFEAEEEVVDLVHDNPDDVALALETEEQSDESEKVQLTEYQLHRYKLLKLIEYTEQSLVAYKEWKYTGEVTAGYRPANVLLDELPEFQVKRKLPLYIDEEINQYIEQLIKLKIADKAFDNPKYTVAAPDEKEKEKISFEKSQKPLTDVIQSEVMGQRAELSQAVKYLEEQVTHDMQDLEAELRSYFVQYQLVK